MSQGCQSVRGQVAEDLGLGTLGACLLLERLCYPASQTIVWAGMGV